mmetsp:Transcript_19561/g.66535  ORF Transcript_19561/g.66535 Transcript_19561/m.66535 type:complete len:427 (-) Transcript_19561:252-1532(-)|eukprot:CAMPEP_0183793454 /NCGR_PEP_ID=MMETSP0803_2-20130417/3223_1 /TAXON_ID=195967 /ORGANISM="Crustomastix stigmata, Strain CCMP3273" /LENGTH=426 /DNA_ID=CAMNT_0026037833 /DNA_START=632 /DNA_END=1912 /DNA_ORIENTATION=-
MAFRTIHRVPTVISLHQEDPDTLLKPVTPPRAGSVMHACNSQQTFPTFGFAVRDSLSMKRIRSFGSFGDLTVPDVDDSQSPGRYGDSDGDNSSMSEEKSLFDSVLLSQWDDRAEKGLFRYDIATCHTKLVQGEYGFIAQLNEGRATTKRPTEFRVDLVCQEFDHSKFNFTKADKSEVLFAFMPGEGANATFSDAEEVGGCPSVVLINVSPIEYGHVLLVPRVTQCLPQRIRGDVLNLAVHMAVESNNPYFRIGYNSLGAYASINHLHFQGYYLSGAFPIERASTGPVPAKLMGPDVRARVERTHNFPVRCIVFELGASMEDLTDTVARACERMQQENIPFNLFIADMGCRIFLIPNVFSERIAGGMVPEHVMETGINPAVFEISGHMLYKDRKDWNATTEQACLEILSYASLSEEAFERVLSLVLA